MTTLPRSVSRRQFLAGLVAGSTALGVGWSPRGQLCATERATLNAARRDAAHRRRRVIFNNDGDDIWAKGANTAEKFLSHRHTPLVGTHVDSIFYCTTQSFNHFTHATKVAEVFESKEGAFADNNLGVFLKQGTDGLRMSNEFAHQHGLESFWTLRMNDIHDAWTPAFLSRWKQADPTRIMSTREEGFRHNDRRRLWSLVDFEHPDVAPRLLEIIGEVLRQYDVDGIELDFLRAPFYFRSSYAGESATDKQVAVLTSLVQDIRALVLRESEKKGKPLLLAARVPSTPQLCRKIGIDIDLWLREKQVDLIALGGGYLTFDVNVRDLIELAHEHDVKAYPALSQSGLLYRPPRGKSTKQPPAAWLGAASRLWADGADGIYTFNLFPGPGSPEDRQYARDVLGKIGSPTDLHSSTIMYGMSDAGWWMPAHYWAKDAADFTGALPLTLKPNEYTRTFMVVPEDLRGAGFDVTAELRIDIAGLEDDSTPELLFGSANFGPKRAHSRVADVHRFVLPAPVQAVTQGRNRVMVKTTAANAKLAGVELWINRGA